MNTKDCTNCKHVIEGGDSPVSVKLTCLHPDIFEHSAKTSAIGVECTHARSRGNCRGGELFEAAEQDISEIAFNPLQWSYT